MYTDATLMFMYCETPLHVGSGTSLGIVDLPIQRERYTEYPTAAGSGIKGALRDWFEFTHLWRKFVGSNQLTTVAFEKILKEIGKQPTQRNLADVDSRMVNTVEAEVNKIATVFGPDKEGSEHAGALSFTDARLLLFPVRSMKGVFAWITCPNVIGRLRRDLAIMGGKLEVAELGPDRKPILENGREKKKDVAIPEPQEDCCYGVSSAGTELQRTDGGRTEKYSVLEEYVLKRHSDGNIDDLARWIAGNAIPAGDEYAHWQSLITKNLLLVHDDNFTEFVRHSTEVNARVKIGQGKSTDTAKGGNLFYEENLPMESLLYSVVLASQPHKSDPPEEVNSAAKILTFVKGLDGKRVQVGGDETVGRGILKVRFL